MFVQIVVVRAKVVVAVLVQETAQIIVEAVHAMNVVHLVQVVAAIVAAVDARAVAVVDVQTLVIPNVLVTVPLIAVLTIVNHHVKEVAYSIVRPHANLPLEYSEYGN